MSFVVYILQCADGTYYVGCTNNLEKRLKEHNTSKNGAHYTKIRRPVTLKYQETFTTLRQARGREAEIKRLKRAQKEKLFMNYQYFISSAWRNKALVLELTEKMRKKGKTVYCFIEGDGREHELKDAKKEHAPEEYMEKFESIADWKNNSAVKELFDMDMQALRASETVILLLPAGKSSHIEAGAAYGMGKKCLVIGEQKETESLYLIFSEFYRSIDDFIQSLD